MTVGLIAGPNPIPCGHWACGCLTISSILAKGRAIFTHAVWQTVLKLRWTPRNAGWPYIQNDIATLWFSSRIASFAKTE